MDTTQLHCLTSAIQAVLPISLQKVRANHIIAPVSRLSDELVLRIVSHLGPLTQLRLERTNSRTHKLCIASNSDSLLWRSRVHRRWTWSVNTHWKSWRAAWELLYCATLVHHDGPMPMHSWTVPRQKTLSAFFGGSMHRASGQQGQLDFVAKVEELAQSNEQRDATARSQDSIKCEEMGSFLVDGRPVSSGYSIVHLQPRLHGYDGWRLQFDLSISGAIICAVCVFSSVCLWDCCCCDIAVVAAVLRRLPPGTRGGLIGVSRKVGQWGCKRCNHGGLYSDRCKCVCPGQLDFWCFDIGHCLWGYKDHWCHIALPDWHHPDGEQPFSTLEGSTSPSGSIQSMELVVDAARGVLTLFISGTVVGRISDPQGFGAQPLSFFTAFSPNGDPDLYDLMDPKSLLVLRQIEPLTHPFGSSCPDTDNDLSVAQ